MGAAVDTLTREQQSAADAAEERKHPALAALLRRASAAIRVAHGGGVVKIATGSRHFVDSFEGTLVGWHGTYDPPCGMGAEPMA